ncbi:MAG TPA: hypothetical protein VGL40_08105 [Bacillota bacterium]
MADAGSHFQALLATAPKRIAEAAQRGKAKWAIRGYGETPQAEEEAVKAGLGAIEQEVLAAMKKVAEAKPSREDLEKILAKVQALADSSFAQLTAKLKHGSQQYVEAKQSLIARLEEAIRGHKP